MLRINRERKHVKRLEEKRAADAGLLERSDIQQMIRNSPEEFFTEMGQPLLLVAEEVCPAEFVGDRIDLLAIDQQGAVVILELKRGSDKLQLLQALSYAGMVSEWEAERLIHERSKLAGDSLGQAEETIEQFLLEDIGGLNEAQRVILLADSFDYEVLVTAKWLTETYGMDIRCCRLCLSQDGEAEYLSCSCVYPPAELAEHAASRRRPRREARWPDWETVLGHVQNPAVVAFFGNELKGNRENNVGQRALRFRVEGKRRISVFARRTKAYVWQHARFADDEEFWRSRLGGAAGVEPVRDGRCLRFYLSSETDFDLFAKAVDVELAGVEFIHDAFSMDEEDEVP